MQLALLTVDVHYTEILYMQRLRLRMQKKHVWLK